MTTRLKYPCLVVDHDDTVVNSTATVHFPCFAQYLREFFPKMREYTLDEYFIKNFDPGIVALFREEIGLDDEGMRHEQVYWNEYVQHHIPQAFPGIREVLWEQKKRGGTLCVVSHSFSKNILRDWRENDFPEPDAVYGWEQPPSQRKPYPHSLLDIMRRFGFKPEEMLMLDDLKPGYDMANACGVNFAAAGWANDIPEIETFMRKNCGLYYKTVAELHRDLFEE